MEGMSEDYDSGCGVKVMTIDPTTAVNIRVCVYY